jgi:hypothetical protein
VLTAEQRRDMIAKREAKRQATLAAKRARGGVLLPMKEKSGKAAPAEAAKYGSRKWQPYPDLLTIRFRSIDGERAYRTTGYGRTAKGAKAPMCGIERAVRRNLFYQHLLPKKVVIVGNMIAMARRTSARGTQEEWFEYVCTEPNTFRNLSHRLRHQQAVTDKELGFRKLRSYIVP